MFQKILKLDSFKIFVKRFLLVVLITMVLFVLWTILTNHQFPTDYDKREIIKETAKFSNDDWIDLTPFAKRSSDSYVIKLSTGTYVFVPIYIYDEMLANSQFEEKEKGQLITVEYDPNWVHTYKSDNGNEITIHRLISLKGETEYIKRSNYITQTKIVKREYHFAFGLNVLCLSGTYFAFIFWDAFCDIKQVIIRDKKRKLKRAKREAYRQKHSKNE